MRRMTRSFGRTQRRRTTTAWSTSTAMASAVSLVDATLNTISLVQVNAIAATGTGGSSLSVERATLLRICGTVIFEGQAVQAAATSYKIHYGFYVTSVDAGGGSMTPNPENVADLPQSWMKLEHFYPVQEAGQLGLHAVEGTNKAQGQGRVGIGIRVKPRHA